MNIKEVLKEYNAKIVNIRNKILELDINVEMYDNVDLQIFSFCQSKLLGLGSIVCITNPYKSIYGYYIETVDMNYKILTKDKNIYTINVHSGCVFLIDIEKLQKYRDLINELVKLYRNKDLFEYIYGKTIRTHE